MFNSTLPGNSIHVIDDYEMQTYDTTQFGSTESVLVIGTAFDGPSGKEVAVYSPDYAEYIFGGTYNALEKKSASLVAQIQDIDANGCRTIYAIRLGGKEISKIYRLRKDVPIYFKVSGIFPSNVYKDCAIVINNKTFDIIKPSHKATMQEKREGMVLDTNGVIKFSVDIANTFGFNANSSLADFINNINETTKNNVFMFDLVDEVGVSVRDSVEAKAITISDLFRGVYTIGRVDGETPELGTLTSNIINEEIVFSMTENSKVESLYPFIGVAENAYDMCYAPGGLDSFSKKDAIDYSETDLEPFEIYKRLGSGYAQTACIVKNGEALIIKPTPVDNAAHIVEISEGAYSVAANLKTNYRVIAGCYADQKIPAKRPTVEDFTKESFKKLVAAKAQVSSGSTDAIHAVYKHKDDIIKKYKFDITTNATVTSKTFAEISAGLDTTVKPLSASMTLTTGKTYGIAEHDNVFWLLEGDDTSASVIMPLDSVGKALEANIKAQMSTEGVTYTIETTSDYAELTTIADFKEMLAESCLGTIFNFETIVEVENHPLIAMSDGVFAPNKSIEASNSVYIPYATPDNFLRQLAQHCEYTSLKTCRTFGMMGTVPLADVSIASVARKTQTLLDKDYQLYVKNGAGKTMYDAKNQPYHIGKNVGVVASQYSVMTTDGMRMTMPAIGVCLGRACNLPPTTSITNQTVGIAPSFYYSESQKTKLSYAGYILLGNKNNRTHIVDGVTMAPSYSPFSRFATFRTIELIDNTIRETTDDFIGKNNTMANRNAIYSAVKSGMDALVGVHIEKYEFAIHNNTQASRLGEIKIDYTVQITDEIRNITNTVTAKKMD